MGELVPYNNTSQELAKSHQVIRSQSVTIIGQTQQLTQLQQSFGLLQQEVSNKEAELSIYYKHVAKLQKRLDDANKELEQARGQLSKVSRANEESVWYMEMLEQQCATVVKKLKDAKASDQGQSRHQSSGDLIQSSAVKNDLQETSRSLSRTSDTGIPPTNLAMTEVPFRPATSDAVPKSNQALRPSLDPPGLEQRSSISVNLPQAGEGREMVIRTDQAFDPESNNKLTLAATPGKYQLDPDVAPFRPSNRAVGSPEEVRAPITPLFRRPAKRVVSITSPSPNHFAQTVASKPGTSESDFSMTPEKLLAANAQHALPSRPRGSRAQKSDTAPREGNLPVRTDSTRDTSMSKSKDVSPLKRLVQKSGLSVDDASTADKVWLDWMEKTRTEGMSPAQNEVNENDDLIDLEADKAVAVGLLGESKGAEMLKQTIGKRERTPFDDDSWEDLGAPDQATEVKQHAQAASTLSTTRSSTPTAAVTQRLQGSLDDLKLEEIRNSKGQPLPPKKPMDSSLSSGRLTPPGTTGLGSPETPIATKFTGRAFEQPGKRNASSRSNLAESGDYVRQAASKISAISSRWGAPSAYTYRNRRMSESESPTEAGQTPTREADPLPSIPVTSTAAREREEGELENYERNPPSSFRPKEPSSGMTTRKSSYHGSNSSESRIEETINLAAERRDKEDEAISNYLAITQEENNRINGTRVLGALLEPYVNHMVVRNNVWNLEKMIRDYTPSSPFDSPYEHDIVRNKWIRAPQGSRGDGKRAWFLKEINVMIQNKSLVRSFAPAHRFPKG